MEAKHTPGPWNVFHDHPDVDTAKAIAFIRPAGSAPREQEIASLYCCDLQPEQKANARLIAAAPELLEVVHELQESAAYWGQYDVPLGIADRINAAIAKATGDQA